MERDEFLRAAWRAMVAEAIEPQRLVFVDEMGANIGLCPLYGCSRRGERVHMRAPRNRGPNTTLLSSMSAQEGMGPCLAVEGSTNAVVFETYIEKVLTPTLEPGQIVVTDNLCAHKGRRVKELIERRGCELLYLPPYSSPDFNPIEEAFAKIKGLLRKTESRSREALVGAMGVAISAISPQDVRGFFKHCGYNTQVQSL